MVLTNNPRCKWYRKWNKYGDIRRQAQIRRFRYTMRWTAKYNNWEKRYD